MKLHRLWGPASTGLMLTMACAAWAWRDCMLLALSTVLAYRLFLLRMDRGAPWRAIAAAVNALSGGVLAVGAGFALMSGIGAAWLGWWQPTAGHPAALLLLLSAGAAWCCLSRRGLQEAAVELRLWLCVLGGVFVAIEAQRSGWALAPWRFVSAVGRVATHAKLTAWRVKSTTRRNGDDGVDNATPLRTDHQEVPCGNAFTLRAPPGRRHTSSAPRGG